MNKVILIGNLTRDPDVRKTATGLSVTSFSLAVNRRFKNQRGETETDFFNIVTWRSLADLCAKYLSKGNKAAITGTIQNRSFVSDNGETKYITEIIADEVEFLTPRNKNDYEEPYADYGTELVQDEELPF